jgi:hypothetical protein
MSQPTGRRTAFARGVSGVLAGGGTGAVGVPGLEDMMGG